MEGLSMRELALTLKLAGNELRHGWKHFRVLIACLVLGVTVMAVVNSLGSFIENTLQNEAKSLLGGDVEVRLRGIDATDTQQDFLQEFGKVSYVTTLRTMLYQNDQTTLVEVKAIDAAYPLVGELLFDPPLSHDEIFSDNGVAVDRSLMTQRNLSLGDTITLGQKDYVIRAIVEKEPDRAVQIFSFGPRVMMRHEALENSGLASTFSLVDHRYRILSSDNELIDDSIKQTIEQALEQRFPEQSWRVSGDGDNNRMVRRLTQQLVSFIMLSGLATFLIAGIGIASSSRNYLSKKLESIAITKILGAPRHVIARSYAIILLVLATLSGLIGIGIAVIIVSSITPLITPFFPALEETSAIRFTPLFLAMWYGILIACLFSVPALLSALETKPSLLFRSRHTTLLIRNNLPTLLSILCFSLLLISTLLTTAQDVLFMLAAIGVTVLAFILFTLCSLAVKRLAKQFSPQKAWLKLAVGNLHHPGSTTSTVIYAIGISLMVLLTLLLTEANIQKRITKIVDEQAPSLFLVDIQPHQTQPLTRLLEEHGGAEKVMLYPMIRGMISKINNNPVNITEIDSDIRWAVRGDRGISYAANPPANANIVAGEWWQPNYSGEPLISVDERFLEGMGLKIGSSLTLNVLGEEITAKVANARAIDYSTFQINFSLMLSPGTLEDFPSTYIATAHLKTGEEALVKRISETLPGVTIIRTGEVLKLIIEVIETIAIALKVTVFISLIAGLIVLVAALTATVEQRIYGIAILKTLGARKSDIIKACIAEWLSLAFITSIIASSLAIFSAWLINDRFHANDFYAMPYLTIATILGCAVIIIICGFVTNQRLFNFRLSTMLRND